MVTGNVRSWRLPNTMHADDCIETLNEAIDRFGPLEIMNTDLGAQCDIRDWIKFYNAERPHSALALPRGRHSKLSWP